MRYRDEGADELVLYDITASPEGRTAECKWVNRVARRLDIPFCVAGGVRSAVDAEHILNAGAEKISINSAALDNPTLIDVLCRRFGSQCVVVGIDSRRTGNEWRAWQYTGDPKRARDSGCEVIRWIREVQDRGVGEIVLNCMDFDGVRDGYDVEQLAQIRACCYVPLIASGGAGRPEHFKQVFEHGVDGALAASAFHSRALHIRSLKEYLRSQGISVRI
jgi:imidazole glycerol-phosphate synthase subunit HisF